MTIENILKNAIKQAIKNGFIYMGNAFDVGCEYKGFNLDGTIFYHIKDTPEENREIDCQCICDVIFSHNFAKAFWGNEEIGIFSFERYENFKDWRVPVSSKRTGYVAWQYHLQQIVLENNPLKYLEKFL